VLKVCALAGGLADKAVSLVYERVLHQRSTAHWIERCRVQMTAVLDALEAQRSATAGPWWFGEAPTHADIMVGCALRFVAEAHGDSLDSANWPALAAHGDRCEAMAAFAAVRQPFSVTPPPAA
jgi:glutathione S-transferase